MDRYCVGYGDRSFVYCPKGNASFEIQISQNKVSGGTIKCVELMIHDKNMSYYQSRQRRRLLNDYTCQKNSMQYGLFEFQS